MIFCRKNSYSPAARGQDWTLYSRASHHLKVFRELQTAISDSTHIPFDQMYEELLDIYAHRDSDSECEITDNGTIIMIGRRMYVRFEEHEEENPYLEIEKQNVEST